MSRVFTFHQLPQVTIGTRRVQYHVIVRVGINSLGDVLWARCQAFLIAVEQLGFDNDTSVSDQWLLGTYSQELP
jgi:hypothetical protein